MPPQILHVLEIDQGLLANTNSGTRVSEQFVNNENSKIGPEFSVWATITLGSGGVTSWNFSTWRATRQVWEFGYDF